MKIEEYSPLALAFLGDAVHTAFVRKTVLGAQKDKMNTYHTQAKKFCNAAAQAEVLDNLLPQLLPEEQEIVRRTRNAKIKHSSKNFDEKTYKKATSFEALIGFLFLNGNTARLNEILQKSIENSQNS